MLPSIRSRANASPLSTLWDVHREMNRLWNGMAYANAENETAWGLPTEVREDNDGLHIEMEIPGVRPDDIELTVENSVLTVSGEKKFERSEGSEGDYRLFERRYGRFSRSFTLPPTVDSNRVEAGYENGVLSIWLPKSEESKPRRIEIKAANGSRSIESKS